MNLHKIPKMVNPENEMLLVPAGETKNAQDQKIAAITRHFAHIMEILGLDLTNDSLQETPHRVAKMYVNELFRGLEPANKPHITVFNNDFNYHTSLVELNIPFSSVCEHHFLPFKGKVNIAYFPKEKIIGLSKLHRIVDYFARRPQVQERLTKQIMDDLQLHLHTDDIGVAIKASHHCIACRGVNDTGSATLTSLFSGKVLEDENLISVLRNFK